ncbi:Protein trichome birefringence-like 19 [Camellia lanceoleosa]|uniref:Protein trichome birefringence-like 19 n=1 Tax=Camellia lanceoleosa TaxID=1840588 RepID=A0ACC0I022_9ERIC|nr:Protein trichome birefringence-like 19 [Camellia lanceoleosa]
MKIKAIEFPSISKNIVLPILTLLLLTTIPLCYIYDTSPSLLPSLEIINNNGSNSIPIHSKNNPSSSLPSLEIIDNNGSIPVKLTNNPYSPLPSLEIIDNDGSTPIHQKNNTSSPLQSLEMINNNGSNSIPIHQKNNPSSPLQPLEIINNNGSIPTHQTNNPSSPLQSVEIVNNNGSTPIHPKNNPSSPLQSLEIIDNNGSIPIQSENNSPSPLQSLHIDTSVTIPTNDSKNPLRPLKAANPVDVSYTPDTRFRRWLYTDYNFTIIALWSPLLVKSEETNPQGILMNLYLDEPDSAWTSQIKNVDIVILSGGQWFFRPFMYYEKGKIIGCYACNKKNITDLIIFYGYKRVFRTVFRTLLGLHNFKGIVFLRAFSPSHYEQGEWNNGGQCARTRPFTKQQVRSDWYNLEMYKTQVKELKVAERRGRKKGLRFRLLDTTKAMMMRPDGHPNHYGHWPEENKTIADCVHWCMPGPIDTWNEFLIQMLKMEK